MTYGVLAYEASLQPMELEAVIQRHLLTRDFLVNFPVTNALLLVVRLPGRQDNLESLKS